MQNRKYIFFAFLILIGLNSKAQSKINLNLLFEKHWTIKTFEIEGHQFPAEDITENDYTIFHADSTAKTIDSGTITLSKWKFEPEYDILTLYSEQIKVTTEMHIIDLNESEFIWQTTNPDGMTMIVHMFSSAIK